MIKINLVPAEVLAKEQQKRWVMRGIAAGVLVLLVFLGVSFAHWNRAYGLQKQLTKNETELKKLQKIVDQVKQLEATAKAVRNRLNVIQDLLAGRFLYTVFMDDWLTLLPNGVWLNNMNTTGSSPSITLSVTAAALREEAVADWLRRLENDKKFSNVELGPMTKTGEGSASTIAFTIKASYAFTPPAELEKK